MKAGLVTADRGVVTVFPPSWLAELARAGDEHSAAVDERFQELLALRARRHAGTQWRFSKRGMRLVGTPASRLSAGQRIFLTVVRLCALQRHAGPRELVCDGSVFAVLDPEHLEALKATVKSGRTS